MPRLKNLELHKKSRSRIGKRVRELRRGRLWTQANAIDPYFGVIRGSADDRLAIGRPLDHRVPGGHTGAVQRNLTGWIAADRGFARGDAFPLPTDFEVRHALRGLGREFGRSYSLTREGAMTGNTARI